MTRGRLTALRDAAMNWNVTDAERARSYPCDRYAADDWFRLLRGIDIDAPIAVTYRWLCQLKVAPYSYDWIDNLGRRSPRSLTPGLEQLEVGQRLMVVDITDFELDHHITGTATKQAERLFGPLALTYLVRPADDTGRRSRLVACLRVAVQNPVRRAIGEALLWGDLIMMTKQLRTLKSCAEATAG